MDLLTFDAKHEPIKIMTAAANKILAMGRMQEKQLLQDAGIEVDETGWKYRTIGTEKWFFNVRQAVKCGAVQCLTPEAKHDNETTEEKSC